MTYIEFFDRNSIENIFSSLAANPERVILVGSNRKILAKYAAIYKEILSEKGKNIEFLCRSVNSHIRFLPKRMMAQVITVEHPAAIRVPCFAPFITLSILPAPTF